MEADTIIRIHTQFHLAKLMLAASQEVRPMASAEPADVWQADAPTIKVRQLGVRR